MQYLKKSNDIASSFYLDQSPRSSKKFWKKIQNNVPNQLYEIKVHAAWIWWHDTTRYIFLAADFNVYPFAEIFYLYCDFEQRFYFLQTFWHFLPNHVEVWRHLVLSFSSVPASWWQDPLVPCEQNAVAIGTKTWRTFFLKTDFFAFSFTFVVEVKKFLKLQCCNLLFVYLELLGLPAWASCSSKTTTLVFFSEDL